MGQAKRETPRWRRKPAPAGPVITVKGRGARQIARDLRTTIPAAQPVTSPPAGLLARTGAYRFRRHLIPVWLLLAIVGAGLGFHAAHSARATGLGIALGMVSGLATWGLTRHLKPFARKAGAGMAALVAAWVPLMSAVPLMQAVRLPLLGTARPLPVLLFASWLCLIWAWARHYRWRPEEAKPLPAQNDQVRWGLLATERKWNATLGQPEHLAGGGVRYPIRCDGIKTVISSVLSASENVAGAWHKPMTEAYAERSPDAIPSTGFLTILAGDSLMRGREWDGAGIDPQTGNAVIGRYADGKPAHVKFLTPRYGFRHALASGTTGGGKSEFLNLLIFIAIRAGIVPVVLDPQEGQSLPFWNGRCLYASGRSECISMLGGLHAGMLSRSRYLARMPWDDDGISMKGMPFFDAEMTGLPPVLIIFDEAHMIMRGQDKASRVAIEQTLEIGRLGRKTGTGLWLGTHLPSLSDLGGEQALRDMLRGGNVISFRTANTVAGGMLGLEKDPSLIPQYFRNGKETAGLSYIAGPDNRPDAPMRTDIVPSAMKRSVTVPELDERFAEAMSARGAFTGIQATLTVPGPAPVLAAVPAAADEKPGRTAADAVVAVLEREMEKGEIIAAASELVAQQWQRAEPYHLRSWNLALTNLTNAGRIKRTGDRNSGTYAPVHASLHAVPQDGHATAGVSAS